MDFDTRKVYGDTSITDGLVIYHLSPCLMFSWPFLYVSPWAVDCFARMNLLFVVNFRTSSLVVFFQIKLVCCFLEIDLASLSFHSRGLMLCLPLRPRQADIGRAAVQIFFVHLDNCNLIDNWQLVLCLLSCLGYKAFFVNLQFWWLVLSPLPYSNPGTAHLLKQVSLEQGKNKEF